MSLSDAVKSIDLYPYSGKPRLVGGLAALALGEGDKGLELLISAVKYSANGQPEVGALAAIVASHLAQTVGGSKLAEKLLKDADQLTGGRCPAIVGALWRYGFAGSSSSAEELKQLWWDDHKPSTAYSRSLFEGLLATAIEPDYLTAGAPFYRYLGELGALAQSNLAALEAVGAQLRSFDTKRKVTLDYKVRKALSHTSLKPALGFFDTTVGNVLAKCKSLPGAAKWPGDDAWKNPNALYPSVVRDLFVYAQRACEQLLEALNQLPALAADSSPLAPTERTVIKAALPFLNSWITALGAVRAAADLDVSDRAAQAWEMYLAARREPSPQPVLRLEGLGSGLFSVVGALKPPASQSPREVPGTRQLSSGPVVSITCPGCKFQLQVPKGATKTNCPRCGKEIVFCRCEQTSQTFPVLSEWTKWTHAGCKKQHRVIRP